MKALKKTARLAGAGYLVIFITGFFANFFVLEGLVVEGNAQATSENILANLMQFRWGIFAFLIMVVIDVLMAGPLYILLKPVNKNLSLLSAWLRLVNGTIFGVALYSLFGILHLLSGAEYLTALEPAEIHARVMLHLEAFNFIWLIGLVFFGLHLFLMGILILKSDYIPKIIGGLLQLAAVGYLTDSFAQFLLPDYKSVQHVFELVVLIPGVIGELSFTVWLLIKGAKTKNTTIK
jgi:hypothetical protein